MNAAVAFLFAFGYSIKFVQQLEKNVSVGRRKSGDVGRAKQVTSNNGTCGIMLSPLEKSGAAGKSKERYMKFEMVISG